MLHCSNRFAPTNASTPGCLNLFAAKGYRSGVSPRPSNTSRSVPFNRAAIASCGGVSNDWICRTSRGERRSSRPTMRRSRSARSGRLFASRRIVLSRSDSCCTVALVAASSRRASTTCDTALSGSRPCSDLSAARTSVSTCNAMRISSFRNVARIDPNSGPDSLILRSASPAPCSDMRLSNVARARTGFS